MKTARREPPTFSEALSRHLERPTESTRYDAYELGRRAVEQEAPVLGAVAAVASALLKEIAARGPDADPAASISAATDFLADYLAPFELLLSGTVHSLTQLEASHRKLAAQAHELERTNAELATAKAAAEQAAGARAAFLASMSHEIRTPLNAILGAGRMLVDGELDDDQRDSVELLTSSGEHLLSVVNEILDFSRVDSGRVALEEVAFAPAGTILDALEIVAEPAHAKGLELAYLIEPDVPDRVVSDPGRLRQILLNLLSNAVKFTAEGDVELHVSAGPLAGPGRRHIRFAVRDTGVGIDPARAAAVFDPFSQADASTGRVYGGSGLGLAIARRLVEAMGGEMSLQSSRGAGSTFTFSIVVGTAEARQAEARPAEARPAEESGLAGRRVLVVDDHAVNRRQLSLIGEQLSLRVVTAGSGAEALAAVRDGERFDAILVDHRLPDLTGEELAAVLGGTSRTRGTPLVLLGTAERRHAPAAFATTIVKPVRPESLRVALRRLTGTGDTGGRERSGRAAPPRIDATLAERCPVAILVADDSPVNRRVAAALLGRMGYEPAIAGDGEEALARLRAECFDLVLLDVHMPRLNGLDVARAIVASVSPELRPRLVALTADVTDEQRRECMAAGMDEYLVKPITVEALAGAIERCCARRAPRSGGPALGQDDAASASEPQ